MTTRIDYRRVARLYLEAARDGRPVTDAVANDFGVSHLNATQMIFRARRMGLLPAVSERGINAVRSITAPAEPPQGTLL